MNVLVIKWGFIVRREANIIRQWGPHKLEPKTFIARYFFIAFIAVNILLSTFYLRCALTWVQFLQQFPPLHLSFGLFARWWEIKNMWHRSTEWSDDDEYEKDHGRRQTTIFTWKWLFFVIPFLFRSVMCFSFFPSAQRAVFSSLFPETWFLFSFPFAPVTSNPF